MGAARHAAIQGDRVPRSGVMGGDLSAAAHPVSRLPGLRVPDLPSPDCQPVGTLSSTTPAATTGEVPLVLAGKIST